MWNKTKNLNNSSVFVYIDIALMHAHANKFQIMMMTSRMIARTIRTAQNVPPHKNLRSNINIFKMEIKKQRKKELWSFLASTHFIQSERKIENFQPKWIIAVIYPHMCINLICIWMLWTAGHRMTQTKNVLVERRRRFFRNTIYVSLFFGAYGWEKRCVYK